MKYFTLLLCALAMLTASAQKPEEIDSLKNLLKTGISQEDRMKTYGQLSKIYIYVNPNVSGQYNDTMSQLANELDLEEYKMKAVFNSSVVESTLGNFKKSTEFLQQCLPYYNQLKDTANMVKTHYQIGVNQIRLDNYDNAIVSMNNGLELAEASKNDLMTMAILNATAVIYKQTYQTGKALEYFNKAIDLATIKQDTASLAIVYNGAGLLYYHSDSLDKAMEYFNNAMLFSKKMNNIAGISFQHRNRGMVFQKRGEYEKAIECHLKALEIRNTLGQKLNIAGSLSDLGEVNMSMKRFEAAEDYFNNALEILQEIEALSGEILVYEQLGRLYKQIGQPEKALINFEKYYVIRDTLKNNELREKINDIEIKYETEKKEKELILKEKELSLKDGEIKESTRRKNLYGLLTGLLIITSLMLWFSLSQSRKRKSQEILTLKREHQIKSLESLLEGEEKERQRIAIELHDGVNGDLSALKFKLSSLAETNNKVINEAIQMIDNSCEQVRAISHNLTPPSFEKYSLIEVLDNYCHSLQDSQSQVEITFRQIGKYQKMHKKDEVAVFRIVQELITNSLKHAKATEIDVQASYTNQQLHMSVEDNGIGFKKDEVKSDGIGLANIDSRVDFLGANLDFSSNNNGTSYVLEIDLKDNGKD